MAQRITQHQWPIGPKINIQTKIPLIIIPKQTNGQLGHKSKSSNWLKRANVKFICIKTFQSQFFSQGKKWIKVFLKYICLTIIEKSTIATKTSDLKPLVYFRGWGSWIAMNWPFKEAMGHYIYSVYFWRVENHKRSVSPMYPGVLTEGISCPEIWTYINLWFLDLCTLTSPLVL